MGVEGFDQEHIKRSILVESLRREGIKWSRYIPHEPTERQRKFLAAKEKEVLYGGAAGGGKSDALLMGGLQYADTPGYAGIIFRKTYQDLALADGLIPRSHEWLAGTDAKWDDKTKTWHFPGGASLSFGYLDTILDHYRYQGSQYQFIGFDELTQHSESKYRYLFSRLRSTVKVQVPLRMRNTSNPGGVGHAWVKRRFINPKTRPVGTAFIPAKVRDNPHLNINDYIDSLGYLDTTTMAQLLDGDWDVTDDNRLVYAAFDRGIHMIEPPSYDPSYYGIVVAGVDPGLRDPYAVSIWAREKRGIGWWKLDEFYKTGGTTQEFLPDFRRLQSVYRCKRWYVDKRKPDDIKDLRSGGLPAVPNLELYAEDNKHTIRPMLGVIVDLLKHDEFHISPKCQWSAMEYENYQYRDADEKNAGEVPIDNYNHLCFVAGTLVTTARGEVPIERVKSSDYVLTRDGWRNVRRAFMSAQSASVVRVCFSDGRTLTGTPNHPLFIEGKGWLRLDAVRYGDTILSCDRLSTVESLGRSTGVSDTTAVEPGDFTASCGRMPTAKFRLDTTFTTRMGIRSTTVSTIWNSSLEVVTHRSIPKSDTSRIHSRPSAISTVSAHWLQCGIRAGKVGIGTFSTPLRLPRTESHKRRSVMNVGESTRVSFQGDSAGTTANRSIEEGSRQTTRLESVKCAARTTASIVMGETRHAPVYVVGVIALSRNQAVYNLTVDGSPEFFANGVLVHNCDTDRYAIVSVEDVPALRARYRRPPDMSPRDRNIPRTTQIGTAVDYLVAQEKKFQEQQKRGYGRRPLTRTRP